MAAADTAYDAILTLERQQESTCSVSRVGQGVQAATNDRLSAARGQESAVPAAMLADPCES